jgi:hypothetical protein
VLAKNQSELAYDQDANVIRWTFPTGNSTYPNTHLMYWIHDDVLDIPPEMGWFFASTRVQAMDWGNAIAPLEPNGTPANPFEIKPGLVFGDNLGYISEYVVGHNRGGLGMHINASGVAHASLSTITNLRTSEGGLSTDGDGLIGMLLEVVYRDGTTDLRRITWNDGDNITPDLPFTQDPDSAAWHVAGIPSFWRSVPENLEALYSNKSIVELGVKVARIRATPGSESIETSVSSGDFPTTYRKTEGVDISIYHDKTVVNMSGRNAQVEFANSRPDGFFCVLGYGWWVKLAAEREKDG